MTITITGMENSHTEEVARIEAATFSEPWSVKAFEDAVASDNYIYIVALDNDKVVGYAGCVMSMGEADITNIAVSDEYRRMGIGNELLGQLIKQMKNHTIDKAFLEVRESNNSARMLYINSGFSEIGVRKNFYRKPDENAILMELTI